MSWEIKPPFPVRTRKIPTIRIDLQTVYVLVALHRPNLQQKEEDALWRLLLPVVFPSSCTDQLQLASIEWNYTLIHPFPR